MLPSARMPRRAADVYKRQDMSNKDVKLRIRERALDLGLPHNQQGWGKLDVGRLLE